MLTIRFEISIGNRDEEYDEPPEWSGCVRCNGGAFRIFAFCLIVGACQPEVTTRERHVVELSVPAATCAPVFERGWFWDGIGLEP